MKSELKRKVLILIATVAVVAALVSLKHPSVARVSPSGKPELESEITDSMQDGTPDFLRLEDEADQQSFRRWFTFLAEVQYFTPAAKRPSEVVDCAALVRYAYREALRAHDGGWSRSSHLVLVPAMDSIRKYSFPQTPLGPALFRLRTGPFQRSDLANGAFSQFANAETLQRFNTFFISRDVSRARAGDLLFYRRETEHMPFHTMIFIARSQISGNRSEYVVYHTGPEGTKAGEIRRLSLPELLNYPDPQWQPRSTNPSFLGVFRWNILHTN